MEQKEYQSPGAITMMDGRFQLQLDVPAFWTNFRQALVSAGNGELGSATDSLLRVFGTTAQTNTIEHKAYQLIFRALQRACVAVIKNHPDGQRLLNNAFNSGRLSADFHGEVSKSAGSGEYVLDYNFFTEPQRHPLISDVKENYQAFLVRLLGLQAAHATVLAATLPDRFAVELADEWQRHDYTALHNHFKNNPFWTVLERQMVRNRRHAELLSLFAKPAFQDAQIALADMYIEPNFWVHKACVEDEQSKEFEAIKNEQRERPFLKPKKTMPLHQTVLDWLRGTISLNLPAETSPLLVLLGQPGQGKTSFCLRTADQLLREHPGTVEHLYLFRLRDTTNHSQLIEDPLPKLCSQMNIPFEENERDLPKQALRNGLLLLDGLDELYMSQGLTMEQINNFLRNLQNQLRQHESLNCRVIVTSRTHYLKMEAIDGKKLPVLHLADLSVQQQKEWLSRYTSHKTCTLTEDLLDRIEQNEGKAFGPVQELVRQPILLHLIAISGVTLDGKTNTAHIYQELFQMMIERKWSDEQQLEKYKSFEENDWWRFLRVLALSIFQSDHEYVRRKDFETLNTELQRETDRLRKKAGQSGLQLQDFVRDLLVSFYFQATGRDKTEQQRADDGDHYAYEFLHKSLQEYLVADHIWHRCKTKLTQRNEYNEFEISTAAQALDFIAPLFETKVISQEIADYLHEIAQNDPDINVKKEVREQCEKLLPGLLQLQFLQQHQSPPDNPGPLDKMVGNFYGFWSLASALIGSHELPFPSSSKYEEALNAAVVAENMIIKDGKKLFTDFLVLLSRRYERKLKLNYQNLSGADLSGADLRGADLRGANLRGAYLRGVYLNDADLRGADLSGIYFRGAYLNDAYLSGADLSSADLSSADLSNADLSSADLRSADLRSAYLSGAYLRDADLCDADLRSADLSEVILHYADLSGADLRNADLSDTDLRNADLRGAYLSGAYLWGTDFENAKMENISIKDAKNKKNANFKGTIYENAPWAKKE